MLSFVTLSVLIGLGTGWEESSIIKQQEFFGGVSFPYVVFHF